jgi:hypothetical protein
MTNKNEKHHKDNNSRQQQMRNTSKNTFSSTTLSLSFSTAVQKPTTVTVPHHTINSNAPMLNQDTDNNEP